MPLVHQRHFPHRQNWDGSYDSICSICFRTIATRYDETKLDEEERHPVCAEWDLVRFRGKEDLLHAQVQ
jgi:hypothetical protein